MTFTRQRYIGSERPPITKNRFFLKLLVIVGILLGIAWKYVAGVGDMVIAQGNYSISSGDTAYTLVRKMKMSVADWRYRAYIRFFAPEIKLQTGTYSVGSGVVLEKLFSEILSAPPSSKEVNLTFLPGWTVYDTEASLVQYGLAGSGEISHPSKELFEKLTKKYPFLAGSDGSFEGFLYPDTYRFSAAWGLESVLSRFLDNFSKKIASKYTSLSAKDLYKTLVLASIVEKEERDEDNRPVIAGILAKRVTEKMFLGADATICYPYGILYRECTPSFIVEHLEDDTPYNTRKHIGLPPTPIASPTFSSFSAAKNPEASQYYYYLHDNNGIIHYGVTLQDHNRNRVQYLGK